MSGLKFNVNGPGNPVRIWWDRLSGVPGGKRLFSRIVGMTAPYTGSIRAKVQLLEFGRAVVVMRDRPRLRNHLHSVHAIALANLAELAGNICLAYTLPDDARFIVAGLTMDYRKKARGPVTGRCTFQVQTSERHEYEVPVELLDAEGDIVAVCTLRTLVGPKRSGGSA